MLEHNLLSLYVGASSHPTDASHIYREIFVLCWFHLSVITFHCDYCNSFIVCFNFVFIECFCFSFTSSPDGFISAKALFKP